MDPITIGIAAGLLALWKSNTDKRKAAELVLVEWDQKLRLTKGSPGQRITIPRAVKLALEAKHGDRCSYRNDSDCGDGVLTVDHRRSLADHGSNYSENLQLICRRHNSSKNKASDLEFKLGIRPAAMRTKK